MDSRTSHNIHPHALLVLHVLTETASYHNKTYCFPNQKTIIRSLARRFGRQMSRRTLCRWTGYLEANGYLRRLKRHCRGKTGQLELHSTLYTFPRRAINLLRSLTRKVSQLVGLAAVSVPAQSTRSNLESHPPARRKAPFAPSDASRKGILALKSLLQT